MSSPLFYMAIELELVLLLKLRLLPFLNFGLCFSVYSIMPDRFPLSQPSKIIEIQGREIIASDVELSDHNRTVYRFKLAPGSYRHTIPRKVISVIVKQQKDEWEEDFEHEERAYKRLKELQGKVIPVFYGRGHLDGLPALILSEVRGITLKELARSSNCEVPEGSLKDYLEEAFNELSKHKALYRDQKLDNFLLCDDEGRGHCKVMAVDLEQVEIPDQFCPWQYSINQEGARSLMEDLIYAKSQARILSTSILDIW